jgi:hypothetical protein
LPAIRKVAVEYLQTIPAMRGYSPDPRTAFHLLYGQLDCDSTDERLESSEQLLRVYAGQGAFLLGGPGLADDACSNHAVPVLGVIKLDIDGKSRTVLIVIDRHRTDVDDDRIAARQIARGVGIRKARARPAIRLELEPGSNVHDDSARSCLRLLDADSVVRHMIETHTHFDALGLHIAEPGIEYMKQGIAPFTREQAAHLREFAAHACRGGEVDTYDDVDYSGHAHRFGVFHLC